MYLMNRAVIKAVRVNATRRLSTRASTILSALDLPTTEEITGVYDGQWRGSGDIFSSVCPTTGETLAHVRGASPQELHDAIARTRDAYTFFRHIPAPRRGELLRQIREALAAKREALGALVSLEMGKIRTEGVGEVQEFIDIVRDFMRSERKTVLMDETVRLWRWFVQDDEWQRRCIRAPGAFHFRRNLALSLAAGNATIWKPSPSTPLCSIAVTKIVAQVLEKNDIPGAVAGLVIGGKDAGEALAESRDIELESKLIFVVSFTGSEHVGRIVASIVMPDADLSLAVPAVFFGAVGTAGQRCTSTRRLYLHRNIASEFLERLQKLYAGVKPADPLIEGTLLGPLHSTAGVETYANAINHLRSIDAEILSGGSKYTEEPLNVGNFVQPTIAIPKSVDPSDKIWSTEIFAPILNAAIFDDLDEAVSWNNAVPQGLSSSLWTRDIRNVGKWIGPGGSDTGIVNLRPTQVNVGTSGAEIGAAFGGNKLTIEVGASTYDNPRGRESGGDAWKQYVRWSSCTHLVIVNFSDSAPLAQGVNFTT
ncbi:hypothetical protein H0H93_000877 [Arthromyces matolae]|nr:hypothetical protein H0H93_000877 [Arthromyces matolae]